MADTKITDLTDLPVPAAADLFVMVDDVAGTPTTKKATLTNVEAVLDHNNLVNTHNLTTDIDHDQLTNFSADEHFTQANITTVGTISSGTWQGTAIDGTYLDLEGTELKSTGEAGGSKFLREDGDGTCSWQSIPGGGDALTTSPLSQFAATTSAQLAGVISDETGSGALVFATSPTLVTPALGTPASGNLSNCTGYPTTGLGLTANPLSQFAATTSAQLAGVISDETGTGALVFANSPTLVTPALGTPASGNLSNCTGYPTTGLGLTANPLSQFASTTSAQLAGVLSDETGSGAAVFATSPTLVTPALGTPSSGTLTNCTGLPAASVVAGTLASGMVASDHGTASTDQIINVCYGTSATPPTASTTTEGTLYVQYTA